MDVSALQGAKSFTVTEVKGKLSDKDLKALENNGKVDLVIQDGEQTVILSGEQIDINEYNQKMGKALPNYGEGMYYNPDLKPLHNMDADNNGQLTEKETRYGMGDAFGEGLNTVGNTIGGMSELGELYGYAYGGVVGSVVGKVVGGLAGVVSAPFTGGAKVVQTTGSQKNVQTWNFTDNLKDIR